MIYWKGEWKNDGKKEILRKQKKWKAWGAAIATEEILMDQEASILFPTMCDKLQKAMAIRPEYDITKEIITEQYQSDQQEKTVCTKAAAVQLSLLFADYFLVSFGCCLLFIFADNILMYSGLPVP